MKKSNLKKCLLIAAVVLLAILPLSSQALASADMRGETIYVIMDNNGTPQNIISSYQGKETRNLQGELPYKIAISYTYNGQAAQPADFLGQAGAATIKFEITANPQTKTYYKDNLALQMQLSLDANQNQQIVAEGFSGVLVGSTKTLSAIILPGQSSTLEVSFNTSAFELQPINFSCMPLDISSMINMNMATINSDISKLQKGINQYVDGVTKIANGSKQTLQGALALDKNGQELAGGYGQIAAGQQQLLDGMLASLPAEVQATFAPQVAAAKQGSAAFGQNLTAYTKGVGQVKDGVQQLTGGLTELSTQGATLKKEIKKGFDPFLKLSTPPADSTPQFFASTDTVPEIQFVMKTSGLELDTAKPDAVAEKAVPQTFWQRLLALFGK